MTSVIGRTWFTAAFGSTDRIALVIGVTSRAASPGARTRIGNDVEQRCDWLYP
jgi:hypothetical protein